MFKKKLLMGVLCITMAAVAFGCGSKKNKDEKSQTEDQTSDESAASKIKYNVDDYVKLGDYKGIEVAKEEAKVTDEDLNTAIKNILQSYPETVKTDKQVVEKDDTVNIDYEGLLDGKAFDNGTQKGANLKIGSGTFIEGFEEQLIGAKVGEDKSIKVTFPKEYGNKDLAGKEVVFNVKINYIGEEKIPELTKEFIKTYTNKDMTIDEFKEQLKSELLEQKKTTIQTNRIDAVKTKVLENSKVKEFPKGLLEAKISDIKKQVTEQAKSQGMELEKFLTQNYAGLTLEDFNKQVKTSVEDRLNLLLITEAITKKEGLELTDKEYKEQVEKYANQMQSTVDVFEKQYGKDSIKEEFQLQKTWNFVSEKAVEK
ncbi:trigger factor [Anaerosacchariphilus polymeriproducens]|uniref:Trigger factor n=1 Tax=Anaerosacchariphilus polymeriproducens TaxID=1812858 RepID=A0A371AV35_9FIRM|nr:trigger factor [Anaerosacchariphilus polymeriproducens]RDU23444.1 trigger factor [Anaerosacchariphilus polymeriproducens]